MRPEDLHVNPLYENRLDMKDFSNIFEYNAQGYKFYWLEAIVQLIVNDDKSEISFDEIIKRMIWSAWYSVTEYHLHLGPCYQGKYANAIEKIIHELSAGLESPQNFSYEEFEKIYVEKYGAISADVKVLYLNVPYRLLSSFLDLSGGDKRWNQTKWLIDYMQEFNSRNNEFLLPYIILDDKKSGKRIRITPEWKRLILDNVTIIESWIDLKKIQYLQQRNPGVPGIVNKIHKETYEQRHLDHVRKLWKYYSEITGKPIIDIYSNDILEGAVSIDHFVPWSYISNDEIWNLIPTSRSLNSKKSDKLPEWNKYFKQFSKEKYELYQAVFPSEENNAIQKLKDLFEACRTDNLNSLWASEKLYIPGHSENEFQSILEENLKPVFDAAKLQGFRIWKV